MAVEKSKLEELSKSNLVTICKKLFDMEFDFESPYDDYDSNENLAETILPYYGIDSVNYIDVDFLSEFFMTNIYDLKQIFDTKDKEHIKELNIPRAEEYTILTEVRGTCSYTETFKDTWSSYSRDLCFSSVNQAYGDGNFDYYMGLTVETDYDNYDIYDSNIEVGDVIRESPIKRKTMIDKLDKKTLLELRGLIDKRLKVL